MEMDPARITGSFSMLFPMVFYRFSEKLGLDMFPPFSLIN